MKNNNLNNKNLSRRNFLSTSTIIAASTLIPTIVSCGSNKNSSKSSGTTGLIPSSKYAGVQIGAITYSFRSLKGGVESILNACVKTGLSSVELMGTDVEIYLGAPKNPVQRKPNAQNPLTSDEKISIEKY